MPQDPVLTLARGPGTARASAFSNDAEMRATWRLALAVGLAGGLAALGGVFFGLAQFVSWDMGFRLLLLMFAAVILGGLGTAYGVIAGSLVVGIVAQVSTIWFPVELQNAWALIVLILVLLVRPQGIFGRRERVG